MGKLAAWTERVFELLADGPKPHKEVIDDAMTKVPRELALKDYARLHTQSKRAKEGLSPLIETTEGHRVRVGARHRASNSVSAMLKNGRLRSYDAEGTRYLALGRPRMYGKDGRHFTPETVNAGKAASWTKRARAILLERGPMRRMELIGLLWTLVPPGQAHRNAESVRLGRSSKNTRNAPEQRTKPRPDDELVEMGARDIVRRSLTARSGFLIREVEGEPWVAMSSQAAELEAVGVEPAPALADSLREKVAAPKEKEVEGAAPDTKLLRIAVRLRAIANQVEEWQPFGGEPAQVAEELRQLAVRTDEKAHEGASRPVANVQE